jgi:hypothetical protein
VNLLQSRIGIHLAPAAAIWSGTVVSYDADTFIVTVSTGTGSLSSVGVGMALLAGTRYIRIRAVDTGAGTITLAENPATLSGSAAVSVGPGRFPFPRFQRIGDDGVVYKDFDVAYPGANETMPPIACCVPEVIIAGVDESVSVAAGDSAGVAPSSTPLSYGWDAGTNGTVTGTGADVAVEWSVAGFRYLELTVTDAHGTESVRHIPAWIGLAAFEDVSEARLTYRDGGWEAEIEVVVLPTYAQRSPVAVVDLDAGEVLFFGWMQQQTLRYDLEMESLRFEALGAWGYMTRIYSWPFVLVKETSPDEWSEILGLDLRRALWVLLYWHSTAPGLVNVLLPETRAIEGQDFPAGTLRAQADEVLASAFWQAFSARAGAITIDVNPLYEADWSGYTPVSLDSTEILGEIEKERGISDIAEARLSGVYHDGADYVALIVRAPIHPEDLGVPVEVTGLAPASAAELRQWAGRHIAAAKAERDGFNTSVAIDPVSDVILALPDTTQICLEEITLVHDAKVLSWSERISGRTFDEAPDTADEDPPPPIVIPDPDYPPVYPPIWDPLPVEEWPAVMYVGTWNGGVYYTEDFPEPTSVLQPHWTAVNDGLTSLNLQCLVIDPADKSVLYALTRDTYEVFKRVGDGSWTSVLTLAAMRALVGLEDGTPVWLTVDRSGTDVYVYYHISGSTIAQGFFKSTDGGSSWSFTMTLWNTLVYGSYNLIVNGSSMWRSYNAGVGGHGYVAYSADAGASWRQSNNLGWSGWAPWVHASPLSAALALSSGNDYGGGGGEDLVRISNASSPMAFEVLQPTLNLGYTLPGQVWFSQASWSYQRLLKTQKIYVTIDGWTNVVDSTPGSLSKAVSVILAPMLSNEDWLIIAKGVEISMLDSEHVIFTLESDTQTTLVGRAGDSPGSSPYTDSIPETAGPLCYNGIQIVG